MQTRATMPHIPFPLSTQTVSIREPNAQSLRQLTGDSITPVVPKRRKKRKKNAPLLIAWTVI